MPVCPFVCDAPAQAVAACELDQALRLGANFVGDIVTHDRIARRQTRFGTRLRLCNRAFDIIDVFLELANALAERRADLRNALGTEEYEYDDQNDHQLAHTEVSEH